MRSLVPIRSTPADDRDRHHPEQDGPDDESLERETTGSGGTRHADPQR